MKYFFFLLLFSTRVLSQNYHYTLRLKRSEPTYERNEANIFLKEIFENSSLDLDPDLSDFNPELIGNHSFSLDNNIKNAGIAGGRFEINQSDALLWGGHRAEFAQLTDSTLNEGWYGFSQYFPETYIRDTTEEVVGQWHDIPDDRETAARSPSNAISTGNGHLKWTTRWDSRSIQTNNITEGYFEKDLGVIPMNKWIHWVVHIKFSHTNTGILEVWMDGVKVIDRKNMPNCFNDAKYPYFKFGVYRWEWGTAVAQRVIYYDEVRVGNKNSSYNEVKPGN